MTERLTNVIRTKEKTSIMLSYNEVIAWEKPHGSDGSSTAQKKLVL